jgi:hypothetical protein
MLHPELWLMTWGTWSYPIQSFPPPATPLGRPTSTDLWKASEAGNACEADDLEAQCWVRVCRPQQRGWARGYGQHEDAITPKQVSDMALYALPGFIGFLDLRQGATRLKTTETRATQDHLIR